LKIKALKTKVLNWLKQHVIASIVILVLLIWAIGKLWPLMFSLFGHPPIAHVETLILKPKLSSERLQAVGTVKAAQDIVVASEVSGTIQNVAVQNGQTVKQGDVLLNIRHDDISANLQKDQAILAQKQLYYQRIQRLAKTSAASPEALNEAMSEFLQAQAIVNADQAQLDKYIIKAPFAGQVGIWQVDMGQLVRPGDALVTLTQLSPAYIDFMLPAKALSSLMVGNTLQFTTSSFLNRIWQGKVVAIDPQLDSATRSVRLRAQIDNSDGKLVPRLYGQVTVIRPLPPQLFIPQEAVIYDPKGASVYILQKKIAKPQAVTLGTHEGNDVAIESGLKAGDEVVTAGMMKLFPGVPVIVNKQVIQDK
jgi:membrane fusion protein (multidrug efflux system)